VRRRLRAAPHWLLLLDFDGTLAPLADSPDEVRLDPPMRRVLHHLARRRELTVYIISGRQLSDLHKRAKIPGVRLLGLHGWERPGAALPPEQEELLLRAKLWLAQQLPGLPGIRIEDKGYALGVHFRKAAPPAMRVAEQVMLVARKYFHPSLRLTRGNKIWELLPRAILGKGSTTQGLLAGLPADTLPIFIGDDTTDESAFAVLPHGLTVRVGGHTKTKAKFSLRDPAEVRQFLERLEAVISDKQGVTRSNA
jgi:trehalose 6-phosphate phosphatase